LPRNLGLLYLLGLGVGAASAGTSAMTYGRIIAARFDRGLGTAFGLMSCGTGLAGVVGPRCMQAIIDSQGWRVAFPAAGLLSLLTIPIAYRWLDREPLKRSGLGAGQFEPEPEATGYTLGASIRMPIFWVLAAGTVLYGICAGGLTTNLIPYLTSAGLSRAHAASVMGLLGLATIVGRFASGFLIDRFRLNAGLVMMMVLTLQGANFALIGTTSTTLMLLTLPIYGLTIGAEVDCVSYCTAKLFGRRWFSSVFAVAGFAMMYVGTGLGPMLFSAVREAAGSYTVAIYVWSALAAGAIPLFAIIAQSIARRHSNSAVLAAAL
jgi:predicted MFS family arabinose efflux permease